MTAVNLLMLVQQQPTWWAASAEEHLGQPEAHLHLQQQQSSQITKRGCCDSVVFKGGKHFLIWSRQELDPSSSSVACSLTCPLDSLYPSPPGPLLLPCLPGKCPLACSSCLSPCISLLLPQVHPDSESLNLRL